MDTLRRALCSIKDATNGREIAVAAAVFLLLAAMGVGLRFAVEEASSEDYRRYETAFKTDNESDFAYAKITRIGDAMAYGTFASVGSANDERLDSARMAVKDVSERYTRHTRTVTTTDSNGVTHSKEETYYTWDWAGTDYDLADGFSFMGIDGDVSELPDKLYSHDGTFYDGIGYIAYEGAIRHQLYSIPEEFEATALWSLLEEHRIEEVWNGKTVEQAMEEARRRAFFAPNVFTAFWIAVTVGATAGFVMLENRWLRD